MPPISPEQFQQYKQLYKQQWNQPVEDGDAEGQRQKTNAAFWVAYCYHHANTNTERNRRRSVQILERVIQEQDHLDDNNHHDNTGKIRYFLAERYLRRNHQRSNQLYRQAVPRLEVEVQEGGNDENFQQAAFYLGSCLFYGFGVDKDPRRGIHCWKAAAELGSGHAGTRLGTLCSQEPYIAELFDWFEEMAGAEYGHTWAQKVLGYCYFTGRRVKKDLVKAVEWYNKAIAQGDNPATHQKQWLLSNLSQEERNKTLGCVTRNQKIEKVEHLIEHPEPDNVPLGLWAHAIAALQRQEHPPWEAPSPTFLALSGGITPQLQVKSSNRKRALPSDD